jgi:XTP/dITP diphosphohydrolase
MAELRRLLVATRSRHKLEELRALLHLEHAVLVDLDDVGISDEAVEDADTFRGNAAVKARTFGALSGMPTLADDSGLEVDALRGGPGVRTRRYAGETATDAENNAKLLRELRGVPPDQRGARYRCALAFLDAPAPVAAGSAGSAASASGGPLPPRLVTRTGTFEGQIGRASCRERVSNEV